MSLKRIYGGLAVAAAGFFAVVQAQMVMAEGVAVKGSREPVKIPQTPVQIKPAADLPDHKNMFEQLADHGIYFNLNYHGEFGSNFHGGQRKHKSTYADQATAGVIFDLDKAMGWKEGWLNVQFTNRTGHNLAARAVNNSISMQQIYGGGQTVQLTQLILQQGFYDNLVTIAAGRMSAKNDYVTSSIFCNFQNNFICGNPGSLTKNTAAGYWPVGNWGAEFTYNMTDDAHFRTGAYRSNGPDYVMKVRHHHGFYWNIGGGANRGWWIPFELKYNSENADYPTLLSVGGAYQTGHFYDVYGNRRHHRGTVWAQAEHMLWKPDPKGKRGIYGFSGANISATNYGLSQIWAGFVYTGPFESRADDRINFFASWLRWRHASRNAVLKRRPNQFMFELNYEAQVTPWLSVTPNIQYLVHPDGKGGYHTPPSSNKIKNAWVVGLQFTADVGKLLNLPKMKVPSGRTHTGASNN